MKVDNVKQIALLFHANLDDCKGQTNAALSRIKSLSEILPENITTEAICTSYYEGKLLELLRRTKRQRRVKTRNIGGIQINLEWIKFSLIDYLLKFKLHKSPIFLNSQISRIINRLKGFDLISAHSFLSGEIALELYKRYNIPYCITWHGSDIHSMPFESEYFFSKINEIIESASANFFVSKALLQKSDEITKTGNKYVLYNGFSDIFSEYSKEEKNKLRESNALNRDNKIIAFVGNLIPVKNASLLPAIFKDIKNEFQGGLEFWIIGNGPLQRTIEDEIIGFGISSDVKFFGNVPHSQMPEIMNCIDLLILPSENEGLPLVTVEALRCGAMVIGSDVGGICEAIGQKNVVSLGEDFIKRFSNRCVNALNGDYTFFSNESLDWDKTAQKELDIYSNLLTNK